MTTSTKPSPYARSFPVAAPESADWTEQVVTQGHADYCRDNGHATWTVDGVVLDRCPRCGDVPKFAIVHTFPNGG